MNRLSKLVGSIALAALCIAGNSLGAAAQTLSTPSPQIYIEGGIVELVDNPVEAAGQTSSTPPSQIHIKGGIVEVIEVHLSFSSLEEARKAWRGLVTISGGSIGKVVCPEVPVGIFTVCDLPEVRALDEAPDAREALKAPAPSPVTGPAFWQGAPVPGTNGAIINLLPGGIVREVRIWGR